MDLSRLVNRQMIAGALASPEFTELRRSECESGSRGRRPRLTGRSPADPPEGKHGGER